MFGSIIWAGMILVLLVSAVEMYDQKLAIMLAVLTMFALFLAHSGQIVEILRAITPSLKTSPGTPGPPSQ